MGKNLEKPEEFIKRFQDEVAKEAILTADSRLRFAKRASEEYKENPTETTLNSLEIHCHLAEASLTLLQSFQGKYKADQLQLL